MDILKTDLSRFKGLEGYAYRPRFIDFGEARMHYIDEGTGEVFLALHGQPSWSYLYRKMQAEMKEYRFVAPDLIGFGKSDKYADWKAYSFKNHLDSLINLIETLGLNDINLIVQDWGGLLGLSLLGQFPDRFKRVIILNTFLPKGKRLPIAYKLWRFYALRHPSMPVGKIIQRFTHTELPQSVIDAYDLPFPDKHHKTGPKSFPTLVPSRPGDAAVPYLLKARDVLSRWQKPALVMFSDKDPVFSGLESLFLKLIPACHNQPRIIIENAGNFLQEERTVEIVNYIKLFMEDKIGGTHGSR